jgi:hypothetical protein
MRNGMYAGDMDCSHCSWRRSRSSSRPGAGWRNEGFSDESLRAARQVDNCRDLCAGLSSRGCAGLSLDWAVFEDEHHITVLASAVTRGLISLFSAASGATSRESAAA